MPPVAGLRRGQLHPHELSIAAFRAREGYGERRLVGRKQLDEITGEIGGGPPAEVALDDDELMLVRRVPEQVGLARIALLQPRSLGHEQTRLRSGFVLASTDQNVHPSPSQVLPGSAMPTHTIELKGRTTRHPKFTPSEVEALVHKGFRFSIYRPEEDEFRLSLPLQTIEDRDRGTLTIEQG